MRHFSLNGDFVVCSKIDKKQKKSGFQIFNKEDINCYQIDELHLSDSFSFPFTVGDVVVSGSTGTVVNLGEGIKKWLFRPEHILAKVEI